MPTVTVYACSGALCSKNGAPIENAVFVFYTYDGKKAIPNPIHPEQSGNVYSFGLPYPGADVNVSAAGHGNSTEHMDNFSDYVARI